MSELPKKSPLWQFVSRAALMPPPAQIGVRKKRGKNERPAREPGPDDHLPLRDEYGEWRPETILERFGPALAEEDHLPRLIVACAVIGGASRVGDLAGRLDQLARTAEARIVHLAQNESLARHQAVLDGLVADLGVARRELPVTRARAQNDVGPERPDGLREVDLHVLAEHARAVILGTEVINMPSVAGIARARHLVSQKPELLYAEGWLNKCFPSRPLQSIQLYWPPDYGRVLVIHSDGRLAYDPEAAPPEPEMY